MKSKLRPETLMGTRCENLKKKFGKVKTFATLHPAAYKLNEDGC